VPSLASLTGPAQLALVDQPRQVTSANL